MFTKSTKSVVNGQQGEPFPILIARGQEGALMLVAVGEITFVEWEDSLVGIFVIGH